MTILTVEPEATAPVLAPATGATAEARALLEKMDVIVVPDMLVNAEGKEGGRYGYRSDPKNP